jgi:general secretion pathway protein E
MQMTQSLQQLILQDPARAKIDQVARDNGMRSLFQSGIAKAVAGETSMEEVLRVTSAE